MAVGSGQAFASGGSVLGNGNMNSWGGQSSGSGGNFNDWGGQQPSGQSLGGGNPFSSTSRQNDDGLVEAPEPGEPGYGQPQQSPEQLQQMVNGMQMPSQSPFNTMGAGGNVQSPWGGGGYNAQAFQPGNYAQQNPQQMQNQMRQVFQQGGGTPVPPWIAQQGRPPQQDPNQMALARQQGGQPPQQMPPWMQQGRPPQQSGQPPQQGWGMQTLPPGMQGGPLQQYGGGMPRFQMGQPPNMGGGMTGGPQMGQPPNMGGGVMGQSQLPPWMQASGGGINGGNLGGGGYGGQMPVFGGTFAQMQPPQTGGLQTGQ